MSPTSPFRCGNDDKRVAFLAALLAGANARLAAARTNISRGTVYRWKLEDPAFAGLWAEIAASSHRRRTLRRRVLRAAGRLETSHSASNGRAAARSPEAL